MITAISKTFQYGDHSVTLETGAIARQATSAVMIRMGDTVILATVVAVKDESKIFRDFFPLTVNYLEKTYSAGKIPGGFNKREGRPSTRETLISRLIDRPIRPLFPEGFTNEVQVIATVMSIDPEIDPDIPAMIGVSAALAISGLPFNGPIGAARVGYLDGAFHLNPTTTKLKDSALDLVVAGTKHAVLMVESQAKELPEDVMLNAVMFGHESMQTAIDAINEFASAVKKPVWSWQPLKPDENLIEEVTEAAKELFIDAYQTAEKAQRRQKLVDIHKLVIEKIAGEDETKHLLVKGILAKIEEELVRGKILNEKKRIDNRDLETVRPITIKVGLLPRTHGSVNFTRGETQALVVTTLGTERDAQTIDGIIGESKETFMLHYNFPAYCVGEVGFLNSPKRREIGHGNLAKRALSAVLPDLKDFPYVIRVVSEITESNGSSSMASVCGGCLSLMDAGVPIKAPVAGIAMGLIKEEDKFAVLTDILGDEDHLGDMDFKVAGTANGVTALQMDIKIEGINREIMDVALKQAKRGRLHILEIMQAAISKPRDDVSSFAPRITTIQISREKIKDVIGKGGIVIREIIEQTGVSIDISDDGIVKIAAVDATATEAALKRIKAITAEAEVNQIYEGKVVKITDFGAFVNILPGQDGLLHISQISHERINNVSDKLKEGQDVRVKVLEIDRQGRVRLSMKALDEGREV